MVNKLHMKAFMRFLLKEVPTLGYSKVFFLELGVPSSINEYHVPIDDFLDCNCPNFV
jgi:hypothetical protein